MSAGGYIPLGAFGPPLLRQLADSAIGKVACALGRPHFRVGVVSPPRYDHMRFECSYCGATVPAGEPGTWVPRGEAQR